MEPQDETSGFSRRRISSILKAPRKSARFPDPEQPTHVVECAKPVEKRTSRRVSFAPANDVLLFSKDVKNASPTRSPLQELMTAAGATTQNRFPGAEDGSQAMETLLNAPLHGLQPQDKVRFDTAEGFGEKTVVFSSDDAFMDMTHSHTINFASYGEFLADDVLPPGGEEAAVFAADDTVHLMNGAVSLPAARRVDVNVQKRNGPSTLASLDPGFEDFLASLSKPGGPSSSAAVESNGSLAHSKDKKADVDKENRLPASVPSVMEKLLNASRKSGQENVLRPDDDDDVSMNLTEVHTGRVLASTGAEDPFQCLFPTEDMYVHTDRRVSQTTAMTKTSSDPKDAASSKNPPLNASHQMNKVNLFAREEKTIMFSADDDFMDMTRSHTINISRRSLAPQKAPADGPDSGFKNSLSGLSKPTGLSINPMIAPSFKDTRNASSRFSQHRTPRADDGLVETSCSSPEKDTGMDITECQTGRITEMAASDDPFNFLFPTQDMYPQSASLTSGQKNSEARKSSHNGNSSGVDTSSKHSLKTKQQRLQFDAANVYSHKAADETCMDVTRSRTVHIGSDSSTPSDQNVVPCKDKTVMFNDVGMDMTQCLTVNIANSLGSDQVFLPAKDRTIRFDVHDAGMDMTKCLTVNIASSLGSDDPVLASPKDKTMRFDVHDGGMDMTQCLTVNIANTVGSDSLHPPLKKREVDPVLPPPPKDKTMRFDVHDGGMDLTNCLTVNIANNMGSDPDLSPVKKQEVGPVLPPPKDKTMRFDVHDGGMDMTKCLTVNIASSLGSDPDLCPMKKQEVGPVLPPPKDKTMRFDVHDGGMDMTKCLTVNIANNLGSDSLNTPLKEQEKELVLLPWKEKTMRFDVHDAGMDMTKCLTVNIANNMGSDPDLSPMNQQDVGPVLPPPKDKTMRFDVHDAGMDMTKCLTVNIASGLGSDPDLSPMKEQDVERKAKSAHVWGPKFNSVLTKVQNVLPPDVEKSPNKANDVSMDMTEAHTGRVFGHARADDVSVSSTRGPDPDCDLVKQTSATSQQSCEAVESCGFLQSVDSCEMTKKDPEARNGAISSSSQKMESSPSTSVDQAVDAPCSRRSRRMSLADLQSKARRLSHIVNTAPDTPLPQLDKTSEKSKTTVEPEAEMALENPLDVTQGQGLDQGGQVSAATTPFNLKTKLMSRISMGGFKPKLPQRSSGNNPKKVTSASGEPTRTMTVNITGRLGDLDNDVSDIFDEELGMCEDMSENLDVTSPQKMAYNGRGFNLDGPVEEDVFEEDFIGAVQGTKRPMPVDEEEDQKRRKKASAQSRLDATDMARIADGDANTTTAPNTTAHATDCSSSSSSHSASIRCEATFESTFKHSLFESQLEDYTCDAQRKLDNGSITVLEFFKLFNIDFVIHNPRQSVLPGRLLSDAERTPIDVLRDRHVSRPKQTVYEADVLTLTEKVEGLKVRMQDLDKPLKMVNKALWEEMRNSSEKELKSFGASLKARNNVFRKTSKAQSHEMKEVLYSNLVQTHLEEQQKLRETIARADEMIKSLDDCICELESELVTVEDKPSLTSQQEEMKRVTEALADSKREMTELELQKKQNSVKLKRTRAEASNLEEHVAALRLINEWKFGERKDDRAVYTFLHDTMHLQLVYGRSTEGARDDDDDQPEGKITEINFKLQLDDEKSQCHARLVHALVSRYVESEPRWVEKYPTRRHEPELLLDVSLVVSRCRLLGEELRLLKLWGALKLDIVDVSCSDTRVLIVFSSLRKCTKFQVIFSVGVIDRRCVVQVESCKSMIGNTEIQQIKDIVASFSPAMNVFTKIVKKIHTVLLR